MLRLVPFLTITSLWLLGATAPAEATERPNILLIITDQHCAKDIGAAGNPYVKTPAIDRLAARGVRFERSYCSFPLCSPDRASIETSRMPHELNIFSNQNAVIPSEIPTMGELFHRAGYRPAWAGKWHVPTPYPGFEAGKKGPRGFDLLPLEGPKHRSNKNVAPGMGSDPATVSAAVKFLGEQHDGPFLLVVSLLNPHDICEYPREPGHFPKPGRGDTLPPLPANYAPTKIKPLRPQAGHQRRKGAPISSYSDKEWQTYRWVYYRLIEEVDRHISTVLTGLEKSGQRDKTLVIFTSDHGEMCGAHGLATKMQMYEEAVNVPLIICPPESTAAATDKVHLVSVLDLLPTLCDYAGIQPLKTFEGRSLRSLVEEKKPASWRDHLVVEMGDKDLVRMVRSERYKYVVYSSGSTPEMLFDLDKDPGETRNLAGEPGTKPILESHRALLKEWIVATSDKFAFPPGI